MSYIKTSSKDVRVVINADDFGYSLGVNESIKNLVSCGRITSATIMANGPEVDDAVAFARESRSASFGVHLNLTEFAPLTRVSRFEACGVASGGEFSGNIRNVGVNRRILNLVYEEWVQQIRLLQQKGLEVSHIDSHHHVHTIPWLLPVLSRVRKRFGISRVRNTRNLYCGDRVGMGKIFGKNIWSFVVRRVYLFDMATYFGAAESVLKDPGVLRMCVGGSVELSCHPGHDYAVEEVGALYSDWRERLPFNVKLITYNDINR